jgi:hypothetical protein
MQERSRASPADSGSDRKGSPSTLSNFAPPAAPRIAPDAHGNEIPLDAKWTKINRPLVSPQVLDEDRRRYEA